MDLERRGKKAFIKGGSVGIGLAVAHALAVEGVDVALSMASPASTPPAGRFGSPEELARFYLFNCSPRASDCVGSSYCVDGAMRKALDQL